jgi:membrane protein
VADGVRQPDAVPSDAGQDVGHDARAASGIGVRTAQAGVASHVAGAGMPAFLLTVGGLGALRRGSAKAGIAMMVIGAGLAWTRRDTDPATAREA